MAGEAWWLWSLAGTAGLVMFMSSLGYFESAVRDLVLMNLSDEEDGQS